MIVYHHSDAILRLVLMAYLDDKIHLAWAVPVNHARLGARCEAYIETRASITTFKICSEKSKLLSVLPGEVIGLITDELTDLVYVEKMVYWLCAQNCVTGKCTTKDHFTKDEMQDYYRDFCDDRGKPGGDSPCSDFDNYLEEWTRQDAEERHDPTVESHKTKITETEKFPILQEVIKSRIPNYLKLGTNDER